MRPVFSCVASRNRCRRACQPGLRAKKRVSQFGLPHPVGAQPSRGESISFLSPARAAGAPTFCDATESRQRTQPRGLRPLGHPPRLGSESPTKKIRPCAHPLEALQNPGWSAQRHRQGRRLCESLFSPPQAQPGTHHNGPDARRNFAKKSPAFACRAAPEPAVARRLARATLRVAIVQLDARLQTINRESSARRPPPYGPDCCSKTAICDRALLRRLRGRLLKRTSPHGLYPRAWAEFSPWRPVASSRDGSATFASLICARAGDGPKNRSAQQSLTARRDANASAAQAPTKVEITPAKHPTGAPGGRCLPALGMGHPGEKTFFVRAPGEILPFQLIVETGYFPFKAWRAPTGCSTGPPVATCMVRALAEIDQTTLGCLIDFLLQQSRAVELSR